MRVPLSELRSVYLRESEEYNCSHQARAGHVYFANTGQLEQLRAVCEHLPGGGTFVNIGTGMGVLPRVIRRLGARTICIDAPFAFLRMGNEPGIERAVCDIIQDRLPLPDGSVDCILFADVIEHLAHSPKPALLEFRRVLKPNGVVVAATPNSLRLPVRLKVLLGYSNWPDIGDFFDEPVYQGHHHEYTIDEFKRAFLLAGFNITQFVLSGSSLSIPVERFADLGSRRRTGPWRAKHTHPLIALGKLPIAALEMAVPSLRRDMMLVAQKP